MVVADIAMVVITPDIAIVVHSAVPVVVSTADVASGGSH